MLKDKKEDPFSQMSFPKSGVFGPPKYIISTARGTAARTPMFQWYITEVRFGEPIGS